ncbi:hypothetical protein [Haloarcula laminariae]|uniref:hypothetical protein n=1 Tax=Haloarcula laminariae TaxID=2961577 RepID=UPI0024062880|nr:hypothetical protein [Halomicroarcula sp. FL173]
MQAITRTGLNSSGTTTDLARDLGDDIESATLGTDVEGFDHHYWRGADCVVVYDDQGVDHIEYLGGRVLDDWLAYVAHERGWDTIGQVAGLLVEADRRRKEGI